MADKYNQFSISKRVTQAILSDLSKSDKLVLLIIISYLSKDKRGFFTCHPSHQTIADLAGISLSTVNRAIGRIVDCNYLSVNKRSNRTDIYYWKGITEQERINNSVERPPKTQEEWEQWRLSKAERLEEEAKALRGNSYGVY